jgi:ADP-heptose:LPS heptosyltransferase
MKTVLISPYAQALRNGKENPKNFPYWPELVLLLNNSGIKTLQIGASKDKPIIGITDFRQNLKLAEIAQLLKECDTWISVDSFLQHLNHNYERKRGVVVFSQSNPDIFGYKENINLLKHKKYLREKQFWLWEQCEYNKDAFVTAEDVHAAVLKVLGM